MSTIQRVELDSTLRPDAVDFERRLRERVVGQDQAIEQVTWIVQTFMAGFNPPGRPVGILLFLGPTRFPHSGTLHNVVPASPQPLRPFSIPLPLRTSEMLVGRWMERGYAGLNRSQRSLEKLIRDLDKKNLSLRLWQFSVGVVISKLEEKDSA